MEAAGGFDGVGGGDEGEDMTVEEVGLKIELAVSNQILAEQVSMRLQLLLANPEGFMLMLNGAGLTSVFHLEVVEDPQVLHMGSAAARDQLFTDELGYLKHEEKNVRKKYTKLRKQLIANGINLDTNAGEVWAERGAGRSQNTVPAPRSAQERAWMGQIHTGQSTLNWLREGVAGMTRNIRKAENGLLLDLEKQLRTASLKARHAIEAPYRMMPGGTGGMTGGTGAAADETLRAQAARRCAEAGTIYQGGGYTDDTSRLGVTLLYCQKVGLCSVAEVEGRLKKKEAANAASVAAANAAMASSAAADLPGDDPAANATKANAARVLNATKAAMASTKAAEGDDPNALVIERCMNVSMKFLDHTKANSTPPVLPRDIAPIMEGRCLAEIKGMRRAAEVATFSRYAAYELCGKVKYHFEEVGYGAVQDVNRFCELMQSEPMSSPPETPAYMLLPYVTAAEEYTARREKEDQEGLWRGREKRNPNHLRASSGIKYSGLVLNMQGNAAGRQWRTLSDLVSEASERRARESGRGRGGSGGV